MSTSAAVQNQANMARDIVNSDIFLKKIFMDGDDQTTNSGYSFAPDDITPQGGAGNPGQGVDDIDPAVAAAPILKPQNKMKWVRIPTTFSDNESNIGTSQNIRMLCVNTYGARESFLIQKRLQSGNLILTNEGHVAAWGDGKFFDMPPNQLQPPANVAMLNPVAEAPSGDSWKNYNQKISTLNGGGAGTSYFGHILPPSARCVFSQNLKWILYALPGYKYSYVNGTPSAAVLDSLSLSDTYPPLLATETNVTLIRDVLDNSSPNKYPQTITGSNVDLYGSLPSSAAGECTVYVLLYNPIHRKKFRDFYRTLLYGTAGTTPNPGLASFGSSSSTNLETLHEHQFVVTSSPATNTSPAATTTTNFNRVMRKYCNAFLVANGLAGNSKLYSYADPSCAVIITGQENYSNPMPPTTSPPLSSSNVIINSSFYTRVGNFKTKNYSKNSWKFKYYAIEANPPTAPPNSNNFINFKVNQASGNTIFTANTLAVTVCNQAPSLTPSRWLNEKAALVGQAVSVSPSYLETFYNAIKSGEAGSSNIMATGSPIPSNTLNGISCMPATTTIVDCGINIASAESAIYFNNVDFNQACHANVTVGGGTSGAPPDTGVLVEVPDGTSSPPTTVTPDTTATPDTEVIVDGVGGGGGVTVGGVNVSSGSLTGGSVLAGNPNAFPGGPYYGYKPDSTHELVSGAGPALSFTLTLNLLPGTSYPTDTLGFINLLTQKLALETGLAPQQFFIIISQGSIIAEVTVFMTGSSYTPSVTAKAVVDNNPVSPMNTNQVVNFFETLVANPVLSTNSDGLATFLQGKYQITNVMRNPNLGETLHTSSSDSVNKTYIILIAIAIFIILVYGYLRYRKIL